MGTRVCIETGNKRVFASALDWPGWCRSGRTEEAALETLAAYGDRYAVVAAEAGINFPPSVVNFDVVEHLPGNGTTDFGAPAMVAAVEREAITAKEGKRVAALVAACWSVFDAVVARAPAELRKGPRGGGRDRDQVVAHVANAEISYDRILGIKTGGDLEAAREAFLRVLADPSSAPSAHPVGTKGWPPVYVARRAAWHVLDHAWEIEDKS